MLRDNTVLPTAVYRVYDAAGRLLYVGVSCDPELRLDAHSHGAPWAADCHRETLTWYDTRPAALAAEAEAIASEDPVYNVKGKPAAEPVRVTLNIPPGLYRDLDRWAREAADAIDVPRVGVQDAVRAMVRVITGGEARNAEILVLAEVRRGRI
jgi:hypothetical protein